MGEVPIGIADFIISTLAADGQSNSHLTAIELFEEEDSRSLVVDLPKSVVPIQWGRLAKLHRGMGRRLTRKE